MGGMTVTDPAAPPREIPVTGNTSSATRFRMRTPRREASKCRRQNSARSSFPAGTGTFRRLLVAEDDRRGAGAEGGQGARLGCD